MLDADVTPGVDSPVSRDPRPPEEGPRFEERTRGEWVAVRSRRGGARVASETLTINSRRTVHEAIDGADIMIDLETRTCFNLTKSGTGP